MPHLVKLDLSSNQIILKDVDEFCWVMTIANEMDASHNPGLFDNVEIEPIEQIKHNGLTHLNIANTDFMRRKLKNILLGLPSSLQALDLSLNNLHTEHMYQIAEYIAVS